jgi:hypothetical protein
MHNCGVAINVFHKERGNAICIYAELNCSVGIYMENDATLYMHNCKSKIPPS